MSNKNLAAETAATLAPEATSSTPTDTKALDLDADTTAPAVEVEEGPAVYGVIANIPAGIAYIAEYASAEDLCDPGHHFSLCFWSESWEECQECLERNFPWALEVEEEVTDYD